MPYASDKLYNGYLRRKMALIATDVKVREILPHLICLTISDREEIEAKREVSGNYAAMQLLLYNLRRRENWPEQFIAALEECEHVTIAREIREEYNSIQGQRNPKPPSPSGTLIKAHVHPEPAINPTLPIAERALTQPAPSEAAINPTLPVAVSAPAQPAPSESAALNPPPPHAPVEPQSPLAFAPPLASEAAPPSEPPPHSSEVSPDVSPQSTPPPPSRDPPQAQAGPPPPSPPAAEGRRASSPQQPEENSESSLEEVPGVSDHIPPDTIPLVTSELSSHLTSLDTALFQPETASTPNPRPVQNSPTSKDTASQNAPPAHAEPTVAVVVTELPPLPPVPPADGAADSVLNQTPEKQPVQDTSPPTVTGVPAMQFPEENVGLTARQVNINRPPIEPSYQRAQTQLPAEVTHAVDSVDGPNATSSDLDDELFSKPAVLLSIQPNNENPQTALLPQDSVEIFSGNSRPREISTPAYSGNSDRLEFSEAVYSGNSDCLEISGASAPVAALLENSVLHEKPLSLVKPEENQTQSCLSSLGDQEVLVHVGHVSGEPSIQNQDANFGYESENPLDQNHSSQVKPEAPVSVSAVSPGWSAAVDQSESDVGDDSQSYEEPQVFIHNGQATITRESSSSQAACPAPLPSIVIQSCPSQPSDGESSHPPEPVGDKPLLQKVHFQPVKEDEAQTLSNVKKYILTAAGVGVCAMIVAWRMKN